MKYFDKNGTQRPYWWKDSDEVLRGHLTEAERNEGRKMFSEMLRERQRKQDREHIDNLKRLGVIG